MSDLFLSLSRNHLARKVVRKTGLPIPLPQNLLRQRAPWSHETLNHGIIAVGGCEHSENQLKYIRLLKDAGAKIASSEEKLTGILFDATWIKTPEDLKSIYEFFHGRLAHLKHCAHVLVLAKNLEFAKEVAGQTVFAAIQEALTGFVRSLAKELGSRGISVNLVAIKDGDDCSGMIRYFMSHHSSFITGQCLKASGTFVGSASYERLLEGRTILVTGAAQGIGAAIARRVAVEGAKVLLLDRPQEMAALEKMAREVHGVILPIDLLKEDAVTQTVKKLRELAPIHGVVHNAGITRDKSLFKMNAEKWDAVMTLNFSVPVAITETMMGKDHDFICAKDASIVYLSSVGGIAGNPGQTNYAASKAGLIGYVQSMAKLTSSTSQGGSNRFNCVAPGFIETRMTQAMPASIREVARRFNSFKQAGEPDDVAQAVVFLLSDASSGINGETLRVCGQNFVGK